MSGLPVPVYDKLARGMLEEISQRVGPTEAALVVAEAEAEWASLRPRVPDPGALAPHLRVFITVAARQIALYRVMSRRGSTAAEVWAVCEQVARAEVSATPGWLRGLVGRLWFTPLTTAPIRWLARRSQGAPLGGFVFQYEEGDGATFDWGVTYTRCAIRDLAHAEGAAEFAPWICLGDAIASEALGQGLVRTETIANGCTRCDFRFKRGGPTRIKGYPPGC